MPRYDFKNRRYYTGPDHDLGGARRTKAKRAPYPAYCAECQEVRVEQHGQLCLSCAAYEAAVAELDGLLDSESTDTARIDALTKIIVDYEDAHVPEPGDAA